jgi:hypothetical protein
VQDNPHRHQAGKYSALRHGRLHPEAGVRCDPVAENGTQTSWIFRYELKKIGFTQIEGLIFMKKKNLILVTGKRQGMVKI